jgi:hypothetical protein
MCGGRRDILGWWKSDRSPRRRGDAETIDEKIHHGDTEKSGLSENPEARGPFRYEDFESRKMWWFSKAQASVFLRPFFRL